MNYSLRTIAANGIALLLAFSTYSHSAAMQIQTQSALPVCDQERAYLLVQTAVDDARTMDDPVSRITILVLAADTIWGFRQDPARGLFKQAYELADKHFHDQTNTARKSEEQRFSVMQAIARHDPAWARALAKQAVEETKRETERQAEEAKRTLQNNASSPAGGVNLADRLLALASSMLNIDQPSALDLAKQSLRYPASFTLGRFLFKLAATDQVAADHLCQEAIKAYSDTSIRDLLFLSAYPFGSPRSIIGVQTVYFTPPQNFAPSPALQQLFLGALFHRAEILLNSASQSTPTPNQTSEPAQVYMALSVLESVIAEYQPAALTQAMTLKSSMKTLLYSDEWQRANNTVRAQLEAEADSYINNVQKAEQATSPAQADSLLVSAIVKAPSSESLDRLKGLAQKVSDANVRQQLLNWLYFKRTRDAIKQGELDDAKQLADKVGQIDLRAYLAYEIAAESLKRFNDRIRASEMLNAVAAEAAKADNTNEKARALLGVAHLFSKLDYQRAFEVMADAVKAINRIANPDLSNTGIFQRIEGPQFGYVARYEFTGFDLGNAFRELAAYDFDGALLLARSLENKRLRSTAIIALSAYCLEKSKPQTTPTTKKAARTKTS